MSMKSTTRGQRIHALIWMCLFSVAAYGQGKPTAATDQSSAGQLYAQECAGCHGEDGSGAIAIPNLPNFRESTWQKAWTDEQMKAVINNGNGLMPTFKLALSPAQISELIGYVRKLPGVPLTRQQERTNCKTCHGSFAPGAVVPNSTKAGDLKSSSQNQVKP